MKSSKSTYIKNIIFPCLVYSGITGILTGGLIFIFKLAVSRVVPISEAAYDFVREKPAFLPVLLLAAATLGCASAFILRIAPDCKGGGIPTSITLLKGLLSFNWVKSIVLLMPSALITYLGGVPLGTEGPSVQMGTAVGRGTVRIFAKKHPAWDRYIMTAGASAGFAAATGAPLTGILFPFEEAHRRFSPMLFMTSAISAVTSTAVIRVLCPMAGLSPVLFHAPELSTLPVSLMAVPVITGLLCGLCGAGFADIYNKIHRLESKITRLPLAVKAALLFVATAISGFFFKECIGSGDLLIEQLIEGELTWKLLLVYFCIRAIILITANNIGITGGLFVPTLCFGAIIGGMCGKLMTVSGLMDEKYYTLTVVTGICAFLAASSHTPLMAVAFSFEALGAVNNAIPVCLGVAIANITVEALRAYDFTDIVIESKLRKANSGKTSEVMDIQQTVNADSFASGKEIRDILWPPKCTVLSVHKKPSTHHHSHTGLEAGDILDIHLETTDKNESLARLCDILGKQ